MSNRYVPAVERFLSKIKKRDDGCWEWLGMRLKPGRVANGSGYGYLGVNGKMVRAHRFAYEQFVAPIPAGMLVLHSCDRPWCVNPEHLRIGTHRDNVRDAIERGRWSPPPPNGNGKGGWWRAPKTHCDRGHPMHVSATGRRRCMVCNNEQQKRRRAGVSSGGKTRT